MKFEMKDCSSTGYSSAPRLRGMFKLLTHYHFLSKKKLKYIMWKLPATTTRLFLQVRKYFVVQVRIIKKLSIISCYG